jgi:Zn-dependent peptidase ImmA (M78 family)
MKAIPQTLRALGWNRRPLTLDHFYDFAERESILVIERSFPKPMHRCRGFYVEEAQRRVIVLNTLTPAALRPLVAWHEVGHALWHTPGRFGLHSKTELEADLIAHCAVVPRPWLFEHSFGEIVEMVGDVGIVRERVKIWQRFGL